jgi:L-amino acid N-acyltransferase YncA
MTNKLKIRRAKINDAQKIRILETRVWGEECTNKYDIPMYIRFGYVYVAEINNKIVGAICAYKTRNNAIYVCDWFVDEHYRKDGIGTKLYNMLIDAAVYYKIITFLDPKNLPTVAAHKKMGFKVTKKVKDAYGLGEQSDKLLVMLK